MQGAFNQMYQTGFCELDGEGNRLPCPDGYGALIGTCCVCALIEILVSFLPPRVIKKVFPPVVTGPVVILIGAYLIRSGFRNWGGSNNACFNKPENGFFRLCPNIAAPRPLPWGSAEFIGMLTMLMTMKPPIEANEPQVLDSSSSSVSFSVKDLGLLLWYVVLNPAYPFLYSQERRANGDFVQQSTSVILGLLVGCIVASATGYFDDTGINNSPVASFIWVKTFKLSVYGPLVLPLLMVFLICACEAIGDITATSDVSRLPVQGRMFESRVQGGILADGLNGVFAPLMTITPMATFSQNNGVIALTRCANRKAGYFGCFFLILAGVFAKFSAALVSIPPAVLGGMTTFLFAAVAAAGFAILNRVPFNRRVRFIVTASMALGLGATVVPGWFSGVFTYSGDNNALRGFYNAITLVLETGFAVSALVGVILNLSLPEDVEQVEGDNKEAGPTQSVSSEDEPFPKDEAYARDESYRTQAPPKNDEEAWTTAPKIEEETATRRVA